MTADRWSLIDRLFHETLARPADERAAYLSHACEGDDALRRGVESLIARDGGASFLSMPAATCDHVPALHIGQTLGPYVVSGRLGEGGMGEVYRARDTKLDRDVAIKVLPAIFTSDPERLARFEREARMLAALNHPHIGAIYGLEESDGIRALILELVDGPTLADRLSRGPLPLAEALRVAMQIADALEAAHDKGIVHRDLKPANIKMTADGVVKVLDFGLAKAASGDGSTPDLTQARAVTVDGTRDGMILGTAAYMSPEQARGKAVDKRTDIWAFGCVLYELLTSRSAFLGATMADTIASIIHRDPDWGVLPVGTPADLRRLLRRCLDKDPRQRLRDIGEARIEIEQILDDPDETQRQTSRTGRHVPWLTSVSMVVGVLAAALVIAWWAPWRMDTPTDRPLIRLDVDLGADVSFPPSSIPGGLVISPDGTRLVFGSGSGLGSGLFTRRLDRLDQPKATGLPGTEGGILPFFSPDGHWVGFYARGKLNKISVDGGAVVPLGDIAQFAGASWDENDSIVVSVPVTKGLLRIPADGGPPETVAGLSNGETALSFPQILPGGKAILFSTRVPNRGSTIEILTLADRRRKIVARGGSSARYLATSSGSGHLVYVNQATLFAIPFDVNKLETRGTAVPVLDDVENGHFDVSRTGTLVYRRASSGAPALMTVQWVDSIGRKEPLQARPGPYRALSLSPDGKRVALTVAEAAGGRDVWVYDTQRDDMTRLTSGSIVTSPTWSPDAHHVVFLFVGAGIFQAGVDGASAPEILTVGPLLAPSSFPTDGKRLAYVDGKADRFQIWTLPVADHDGHLEAGLPEPFLTTDYSDQSPSFSPDGRWLAYESNESGKSEVYVRAFPPPSSGQGRKWLISNDGGRVPRWSRSGHELVYEWDDQLLTVSYMVKGDTFDAAKPRVWIHQLGGTAWDLAPDGKRVAVLTPVATAEAPRPERQVVFLQNFFDELRRRVPVSR